MMIVGLISLMNEGVWIPKRAMTQRHTWWSSKDWKSKSHWRPPSKKSDRARKTTGKAQNPEERGKNFQQ